MAENLACDIPSLWHPLLVTSQANPQKHLKKIASYPICNARRAETALGLKKLRKFTQTKCKPPGAPTDLLWVKWPPFFIIPNQDLHLKFLTGDPGPTQMVAAISKYAKQLLGQGSTTLAWATCLN